MRIRFDRQRLAVASVLSLALLLTAGLGAVRFGNHALERVLVACKRMLFLFGEHLSAATIAGIALLAFFASGAVFAIVGALRDTLALRVLERRALKGAKRIEGFPCVRLTVGLPYQAWTAGIIRPRVYIASESFADLSAGERKALIAHEMAHVRNHDILKRACIDAVRRLFWFVPTLGEVASAMKFGQEVRADRAALSAAGRRALCSLYISTFGERAPAHAPGFAFATPRLAEVLEGRAVKAELSSVRLAVSVLSAGIILFGGWQGIVRDARAEAPATCAIIETMAPQSFTPIVGRLELHTPLPELACSEDLSC